MTIAPPPSGEPVEKYRFDPWRYLRIVFFFGRIAGLAIGWYMLVQPLLGRGFVRRGENDRLRRWARQFRQLAVKMGGVMIKLGQFVSSRVDVLPPEIIQELAGLQDEVPPVPFSRMEATLREGLGPAWRDLFTSFDQDTVAAASFGQAYRARLKAEDGTPGEQVVIDLQRWLQLRAKVEAAWLRGDPPSGAEECGGDSTAYVACDGPYFVQVRDPGVSPPNLARVSEMAVGILRTRQTVYVDQAEVWVDDIRLDNVVDAMGLAGAVDVRLQAADVADLQFSYQNRDGRFQQLGENPTFSTDGQLRFGSTLRLDKFIPGGGFSIPFGFQTVRTSSDPLYLNRSDVLAGALPGLRRPRSTLNTFSIAYRKIKRGSSFLERAILDPFSLQGSLAQGTATTTLSDQRTTNRQVRADYNNVPQAVTTAGAPSFLVKLVDALPGFIRNSEFGRSLHSSQLRVNPAQLRGSVYLVDNQSSRNAYRVPVALASDTAIRALTGAIHTLRADAGLSLQPYQSLNLQANIATTRDLQDYGDSTTIGRLLRRRRQQFLGMGMGFERQRVLTTGVRVNPALTSWFRPRFAFTSTFSLNRDPNQRLPVREIGDTAGAFRTPETISNSRSRDLGATFTPARLIAGVFGDSSFISALARRLEPIDVSIHRDLRSSFDRSPFDPSFAYQLGFGGVDEFRQRQNVLATSAARMDSRNASGSVRLPLGLLMRLRYRDAETHNWSLRAGQNEQAEVVTRLKEWPSASASWTWSPRGGFRRLLSIFNTSVGYAKTRNETVQPGLAGGAGSTAETRLRTLTPTVNLTWAGGVQTSLQYSSARSDRLTSGNVNRQDQRDWNGSLNFAFRTPIVRLPNEIRTTIQYGRTTTTVCLIQAGSGDCTPVSETYRRTIDIRMDTGISPQIRGGANFSHVLSAQREVSRETSHVVFSIFVNVYLISGQFR